MGSFFNFSNHHTKILKTIDNIYLYPTGACSLMVRIPRLQRGDLGSIPGRSIL